MSLQDFHRIDEAYHNMYKKQETCLEYVDPEAAELARQQREEKGREKERSRDHVSPWSSRRSYRKPSRWDNPDAPSSRSGAYDDDYHGEDAEEELGVDPKEADELEAVMKGHGKEKSFFKDEPRHEPDFQKTDVWKAFKTIQAGQWSEDDFLQWARSVWAAGAEESRRG